MTAIILSSARPQRFVLEVEASEDSIRLRMRLSANREPWGGGVRLDRSDKHVWAGPNLVHGKSSTVSPELSFGIQSNRQQFWHKNSTAIYFFDLHGI